MKYNSRVKGKTYMQKGELISKRAENNVKNVCKE